MGDLERRGGTEAAEAEEERLLMEEVTVLDFDMLCSTVAMQAQRGKWGKLGRDTEEEKLVLDNQQYGGGVLRMWEGELVCDCFDDRRIALQSTCCPCYRFGKNMKRAGFGSCFLQGSIHLILVFIAVSNLMAFIITGRHLFLYLAICLTLLVGTYLGYYRMLMARKFNISGGDSSLDDCLYHLICPCCTLCQESRTLEMNNVQDGIWHGRGDIICVPPLFVSTNSPEILSMQKNSNDTVHL